MYLHRMIYYSRNAIKELQKPIKAEVRSILDQSARNNPPLGITGALLFNGTFFAQILEGDRKAVTETFCRISNDPRHTDIVIMEMRPIDRRRFSDWCLAFAGHSDEIDQLYVKYGLTVSFNPAKMTARSLLEFVDELFEHDEYVTRPCTDHAAIAAAVRAARA